MDTAAELEDLFASLAKVSRECATLETKLDNARRTRNSIARLIAEKGVGQRGIQARITRTTGLTREAVSVIIDPSKRAGRRTGN